MTNASMGSDERKKRVVLSSFAALIAADWKLVDTVEVSYEWWCHAIEIPFNYNHADSDIEGKYSADRLMRSAMLLYLEAPNIKGKGWPRARKKWRRGK